MNAFSTGSFGGICWYLTLFPKKFGTKPDKSRLTFVKYHINFFDTNNSLFSEEKIYR